jgi:DNA polymerase-1
MQFIKIESLEKPGDLRSWIKDSVREGSRLFALDLETTGLHKGADIISVAITGPTADWIGFVAPCLLSELMESPEGTEFVFHNAPFDLKMLSWFGIRLQDKFKYRDTLILSHLLDESGEHGLGPLVLRYFNDNYKEEFWSKYKKAEDAPKDELAQYNAKDVSYTRRLYDLLNSGLSEDGVPESLVRHVHDLQRSLLETEIVGIAVDRDYLLAKGVELKTKIESLLPRMRQSVADEISVIECDEWVREIEKRKTTAGRNRVLRPTFSFDSPKQLVELLYTQLRLEKQYNEKTKNVSADWDALEKLKDRHPVIPLIQEYREAQKIYSTYVQGTLDRMVDGRIYPSFNCAGTATGRISHSNPNLGNMPRDGGLRGMFIPDPGNIFISADYSSLEVFVEAHFTQDKNLMRLVNEGISKHDLTAAEVGIERNTAKTVNFLAQYHGTAFKLCKVLGISQGEAQKILDKYWAAYGGCKALKAETDAKVIAGVPIINPFGRRRRFEKKVRKEWDGDFRQAYNALIQGTGSDCTSWALYTVDARLRERGWGRVLLSVHDELLISAKIEHKEAAAVLLVETMQEASGVANLSVRLKAEPYIMEEMRWQD